MFCDLIRTGGTRPHSPITTGHGMWSSMIGCIPTFIRTFKGLITIVVVVVVVVVVINNNNNNNIEDNDPGLFRCLELPVVHL